MRHVRALISLVVGLLAIAPLAGCPQVGALPPLEFIAGQTGDRIRTGDTASVEVLSPVSDLSISGGTPVEVNWRAIGTTTFATVEVIIDVDLTPDNGNEIRAEVGLSLAETTVLLDTTRLEAGGYFIGVVLFEVGELVAFDYAQGRITVNERPTLSFTSPRDNFVFDRTESINPQFDVAWTLSDPDSILTVRVYLDPDSSPNGNEILLRESNAQNGDSFTFDLPTAAFEPGTYRIVALVGDGVETFAFYAPGSIRLRARLAGFIDLRDMHLPSSGTQGAVFEGFNPRDNAGSFVASARDIDGDGFGDFIILAQFGKPQYELNTQRTGVGEAYLIYGRDRRFSGTINLNSTGTLFRGEVYTGVPEVPDPIRPTRGITSFAVLSDWDADGIREFAFGLPFVDSLSISVANSGTDAFGFAPLDVNGYFRSGVVVIAAGSSLRPDLGFPGANVMSLAAFGTVAHFGPPTPAPCPEGFYGPKAPNSPIGWTLYYRHLADVQGQPNIGSIRLGCRFSSNDFGDQFGETVSRSDYDGLLISAPNRDPFVVSFTASPAIGSAGTVHLFFDDAAGGFFPWTGVNAPPANAVFNYPGTPEGALGTLPHHGPYHYIIDDLRPFEAGLGSGASVLLSGSPGYFVDPDDSENPCDVVIDLAIDTPANSVRFWAETTGARLGNAVGIEDFNADGLTDMLIGAPLVDDARGACFVVLGRVRDLVRGGELRIEELGLPMNSPGTGLARVFDGIRVRGNPGDRLGQAQDGAGDFNHDGVADVIIGSPLLNNRRGGAVVFFGSRAVINLTEEEIPFSEIPDRGLGVIFVGEEDGDLAGARVAGVGDIDGDGNDDVLIAAPSRSVRLDIDQDGTIEIDRTGCGVVYLVYGSPKLTGTLELSRVGTPDLPGAVFVGRNSGDFLGAGLGEREDRSFGIAGAGDIDGDGHNDLLLGSVRAAPRDRVRAGEAYLLYGVGE